MSLSIDLDGKKALVTGASGGIGLGIAEALAHAGCDVADCARELADGPGPKAFQRAVCGHGRAADYRSCDLSDAAAAPEWVRQAARALGGCDLLVSNAGRNVFKGAAACTNEDWNATMELDLAAHWRVARASRPWLEAAEGGGVVIAITSNHAWSTIPGCFPYNVAKVGMVALVQSSAIEWGPRVRAVVEVEIDPFRACLLRATSAPTGPGVLGSDYQVVRDVPDRPVHVKLLAMPGETREIRLPESAGAFRSARLDGRPVDELLTGHAVTVDFSGTPLEHPPHRKLGDLVPVAVPADAEALYEATVFAADNNALEIRALERSGPTAIPQVRAARETLLDQPLFAARGLRGPLSVRRRRFHRLLRRPPRRRRSPPSRCAADRPRRGPVARPTDRPPR